MSWGDVVCGKSLLNIQRCKLMSCAGDKPKVGEILEALLGMFKDPLCPTFCTEAGGLQGMQLAGEQGDL